MVKTIKIDDNTHAELSKLGSIGQTFNDVIWMLIKEHKEREKSKR
jgi:predicted CopG family antitoxin